MLLHPTLQSSPSTHSLTDYVSVVLGIFAVLVAMYWWIYGKTFLGPVRIQRS